MIVHYDGDNIKQNKQFWLNFTPYFRDLSSQQWALLEFEKPIVCRRDSLAIGSRFDADIHANKCRWELDAYLPSCHCTASDAKYWTIRTLFIAKSTDCPVFRVWSNPHLLIGVPIDPMFLWPSSNSCPLNLLLVQSHQAEILIKKRHEQGAGWAQIMLSIYAEAVTFMLKIILVDVKSTTA